MAPLSPTRPAKWITFEPWASRPEDVLFSPAPQTTAQSEAFKARIEAISNQYAKTGRLLTASATLRGPFDSTWRNPWKQRCSSKTTPERHQARPSNQEHIPQPREQPESSTACIPQLVSNPASARDQEYSASNIFTECSNTDSHTARKACLSQVSTNVSRPSSREQCLEVLSPWLKFHSPRRSRVARRPPAPTTLKSRRPPSQLPDGLDSSQLSNTNFSTNGQQSSPSTTFRTTKLHASVAARTQVKHTTRCSSPPKSPATIPMKSSQLTDAAASSLMTPSASDRSEFSDHETRDKIDRHEGLAFTAVDSFMPDQYTTRDTASRIDAMVSPPSLAMRVALPATATQPLPSRYQQDSEKFEHLPSTLPLTTRDQKRLQKRHEKTLKQVWPGGMADTEWLLHSEAVALRGGPCLQIRRSMSDKELQDAVERAQYVSTGESQDSSHHRGKSQALENHQPAKRNQKKKGMAKSIAKIKARSLDGTFDELEHPKTQARKKRWLMQFDTPEVVKRISSRTSHRLPPSPRGSTQGDLMSALSKFNAGLLSPAVAPAHGSARATSITPLGGFGVSKRKPLQGSRVPSDPGKRSLLDPQDFLEAAPQFCSNRDTNLHGSGDHTASATEIYSASPKEQSLTTASQLNRVISQTDSMLDMWDIDSVLTKSKERS